MEGRKKASTLAIYVRNRAGVLLRVVGLFSRRGYNIDSLSVGETQDPVFSRITVVVTCDRPDLEQLKRQIEKLVDVVRVFEMTRSGSIQRELVLIKIEADIESRSQLIQISEIFNCRIAQVTPVSVTVELTGDLDKIDSFMTLIEPFRIIELVRTGITAIERGSRAITDIEFEN
ncbi:MAG: acetolactate synthase small subunit [Spirochaetales bacterium]|nr:acetolactate synthase small subunit [Spirochaetales bacterium]